MSITVEFSPPNLVSIRVSEVILRAEVDAVKHQMHDLMQLHGPCVFMIELEPAVVGFEALVSWEDIEVDKYINDPLCGFRCTNQLWIDLLGGLADISAPANLAKIRPALPLLVIGGQKDPVSDGKRLGDLAQALRNSGNSALTLKVYPDARHELLNETNRDEVTADLLAWLKKL